MKDHIRILFERYGISTDISLDIISAWPGLLGVIELERELDRLEAKLSAVNIKYDGKYLTKLIVGNPRVMVQNIDKKFKRLVERYPSWNMQKCAQENPRLLTMKLDIIEKRVENMKVAFHGYDIDISQIINSHPPILNSNFSRTIDSLILLKKLLPSCNLNDLATKYIKLSQKRMSSTLRSIERTWKVFREDILTIDEMIIRNGVGHLDKNEEPLQKLQPLEVSNIVKACGDNRVLAAKKIVDMSPQKWWEGVNANVENGNVDEMPSSVVSSSFFIGENNLGESRVELARRLAARWH